LAPNDEKQWEGEGGEVGRACKGFVKKKKRALSLKTREKSSVPLIAEHDGGGKVVQLSRSQAWEGQSLRLILGGGHSPFSGNAV